MANKSIYYLGCIILFLGLFWLFLPHALHNHISADDSTSHSIHILQGLVGTILGLVLIIYYNTRKAKR